MRNIRDILFMVLILLFAGCATVTKQREPVYISKTVQDRNLLREAIFATNRGIANE